MKSFSPKRLGQPIHPSWHVYASIVGVTIGTIVMLALRPTLRLGAVWIIISILLLLSSILIHRAFCLIFAVIAGLLLAYCRVQSDLTSQFAFASLHNTTITITGHVSDFPEIKNNLTVLHLDQLSVAGESLPGIIYVQVVTDANLERSDLVTLTGKLTAGFGTYVGALYRPQLLEHEKPDPPDYFAQLKTWFSERVHDFVASPAADLGLGYLMGQKAGLSEDLTKTLALVGMTHVVVASGAHLGILVSVAKRCFGKLSKFAGTFAALLMIGFFVMIVGFTPSMTRAALVTALSLLAGYFGRKFTPWRLLLFVAALTLFINPMYFVHLGWQLSFASFFGILILGPMLGKMLYGGKKLPWLASMLITSIATSFTCAPILIYNFGSISLLALIANLIILPTLPYAMLLIFLTGISSFLPLVATFFGHLATWLLEFHIMIVNLLSTNQSFIMELPASQAQIFWLYAPIIFLILCYNIKNQRKSYHDYSFRS